MLDNGHVYTLGRFMIKLVSRGALTETREEYERLRSH
jgi:hypothetical protein